MEEFPSVIIQFVVSDVSKELLPRMTYSRCRYVSFDLSKPPEPQGFKPASFDVITGFHVLHVVEELTPSLAVLNDLLVPGGSLLIGDLNGDSWTSRAPGSLWFDFVFGSFAEWFGFTDNRSHCTISTQQWRQRLHTAGFGQVYTAEFAADPLLFTLDAQKFDRLILDRSNPEHNWERLIFHYRQGDEGQLRDKVSVIDTSNSLSLWLFTGLGFDGNAGMGFFRSLGREYPLWDIHFVSFDGPWSEREQSEFVHRLSCIPGLDPLLRVDEQGAISVPRVVPSAAPNRQYPFQPSLPWTLSESELTQTSLIPQNADLVTVKVIAMSRREANLRTFVGRVLSTVRSTNLTANDLVLGLISSRPVSNIVTVNHASLALLPEAAEEMATRIAGAALGILIGCLACGLSSLRSSRRRQGGKVLLCHGSEIVAPCLRWCLRLWGMEVVEAKSESLVELGELAASSKLVLSGSDDQIENQAFSQAVARKCRTYMWNCARGGVEATLNQDPLVVGEALDAAVELFTGRWPHNDVGFRLSDISIPGPGTIVASSTSLFDSNKAYILVGGLGGLGIRIAVWMYQVRAATSMKLTVHK
jgi:SAM-dependent methyltransferase